MFRSTNGGKTWSPINNGLAARFVAALVIDPLTPPRFMSPSSTALAAHEGVYKSTDGGNSWNLRRNGMTSTNLRSLAIDPVTPTTLYAGLSMVGSQFTRRQTEQTTGRRVEIRRPSFHSHSPSIHITYKNLCCGLIGCRCSFPEYRRGSNVANCSESNRCAWNLVLVLVRSRPDWFTPHSDDT